jgi:hypothetical protein
LDHISNLSHRKFALNDGNDGIFIADSFLYKLIAILRHTEPIHQHVREDNIQRQDYFDCTGQDPSRLPDVSSIVYYMLGARIHVTCSANTLRSSISGMTKCSCALRLGDVGDNRDLSLSVLSQHQNQRQPAQAGPSGRRVARGPYRRPGQRVAGAGISEKLEPDGGLPVFLARVFTLHFHLLLLKLAFTSLDTL